jgi:serine/threonine protein kinase
VTESTQFRVPTHHYTTRIILNPYLPPRRHPNINNEILMEKRALNQLVHPNIVRLHHTSSRYSLVLRRCNFTTTIRLNPPTNQPTYLSAYLPTYRLPTCLPTYPPSSQDCSKLFYLMEYTDGGELWDQLVIEGKQVLEPLPSTTTRTFLNLPTRIFLDLPTYLTYP